VSKGAEIRERLALVRPIWRVGGPGGRDVRWNDASSVAGKTEQVKGSFGSGSILTTHGGESNDRSLTSRH
jgi:hypothetical protein